jgi:stearoyl-CoA desaturase (Delta-9 desaturase)
MTRTAKIANLLTVVLPPLIILAAIVAFWNEVVGVHDLLVALVMYLVTGLGVTVGFHRMLTHRSFRTSKCCSASRSRRRSGGSSPAPTRAR